MKTNTLLPASLILLTGCAFALAAEPTALRPLLAIPDKVLLQDDYTTAKPLPKGVYAKRQGTQWAIEDGVLRGQPSTPEFQAKQKDHSGYEPRLSIPACPQDFIIQFDVRFLGGQPTGLTPHIEIGHHMARLTWANGGEAKLTADHESILLANAPGFKIEPDRWYRALAEIKGEEFVIQFAEGPTIYGSHPTFAGEKTGFGVAGNRGGKVELDNITVWAVKPALQPEWAKTRAALPQTRPVAIEKATGKSSP